MEEVMCYIPENLEEALAIIDERDAMVLAGGSDLMVSGANGTGVNPSFSRPVVIISNLSELKGIKTREDGWTEIGALSTSREIAESPLVHPLVRSAASQMGAVALRNSATIGGNIANASPKGDIPQPLILLDAEVVLKSIRGERRMKVDDFILGAKKTKLERGEIISSILIMDAKAQLRETVLSVKEIAYSLGFTNLSFFNKYFRQHTGLTPREYRRTNKPIS